MRPNTAKKIIENDEVLDVGKMAEAVLKEKERESKKHPSSVKRALDAWNKKRARIKEEEEFRQAIKKIWNKRKEQ